MEDTLKYMLKECTSAKYSSLKTACLAALDLLEDSEACSHQEAHQLREKMLLPIRLSLESTNGKLSSLAVVGLQSMMRDDRFHTSIESDKEEEWLPMQIIYAVANIPKLSDEIQIEVMKVLLNMTFSTVWCMNARVIISISEVCLDVYYSSSHSSIRMAVQATFTQLLTCMVERMGLEAVVQPNEDFDALSDFNNPSEPSDSITTDVITILEFLCERIVQAEKPGHSQDLLPLLLEGVYAMLNNIPESVNNRAEFIDLLWKQLCPSLIWLLGNPTGDKSITSQKTGSNEEMGRGSACSTSAPRIIGPAVKTVYNIAVELVRLVGSVSSLRPVLQSVFHRMLLYLPPHHRLEALKSVKELLTSPASLYKVAGPTIAHDVGDSKKPGTASSDMALLRLIVDSLQESCLCNDSSVCMISVTCVDLLLRSVEQLCHGEGLSDDRADHLLEHYSVLDSSPTTSTSTIGLMKGRDVNRPSTVSSQGEIKASLSADTLETESECSTSTERCCLNTSNLVQLHREGERQCAREFVKRLGEEVATLLDMCSSSEVDEALQQFASQFCSDLQQDRTSDEAPSAITILNADGVYVTVYYSLLLNLKLIKDDFYGSSKVPLVSESQFIDNILGSGLLLYVSNDWLSEVYKQVVLTNMLSETGHDNSDVMDTSLIHLIADVDGLGSRKLGGQLLTDCQEEETLSRNQGMTRATEAGLQFAHQILITCWDGILDVLCVLISGTSSCGISMSLALLLGTDSAREEVFRARQAICTSLDGLQRAARLTCTLGLQNRCGALFEQLANASCVFEDQRSPSPSLEHKLSKTPLLQSKPRPARLHTACVLSLDTVLTVGMEMASHSPDCWKHVLRCCAHVSELEHMYFSREKSQNATLTKYQTDMCGGGMEEQSDVDMMLPVTSPVVAVTPQINVADFVNESSVAAGWESNTLGGGVLSVAQTDKVLCGLSQYIEKLFDESALTLNLQALVSFLTELCKASRQQLFCTSTRMTYSPSDGSIEGGVQSSNILHLHRLGDVLVKVVNSNRPLLHIMKSWSAVSSHLVEAACHRDRRISKKAVACLHECVTSLLSRQPELPHFHLHEFLCKPFENLLCLELCDGDAQDQIVCSICELVEACSSEIKSGWRPLFAALRCVKIECTAIEELNEARQRHVSAVLDVFEVFLNTDNVLVFANAAMDCVLCLLNYVRGAGETDSSSDSDSDSGSDLQPLDSPTENLCLPALKYLHRCCVILARMRAMPACPVFSGANRLQLGVKPKCVSREIPDMDINEFQRLFTNKPSTAREGSLPDPAPPINNRVSDLRMEDETQDTKSVDSGLGIFGQQEHQDQTQPKAHKPSNQEVVATPADENCSTDVIPSNSSGEVDDSGSRTLMYSASDITKCALDTAGYVPQTLEVIDNHTGILKIWYLIIEGLANAVTLCPKNYQSQTVDTLFELLREASKTDGCVFSLHCVNHLILPLLQTWLRRDHNVWDHSLANFKQYCGLSTDLAVEYIVNFVGQQSSQRSLGFMLQQLLDVLVECVAQPTEAVSRLGCACIRHILLSAGPLFTDPMWTVASKAVKKAFEMTTYPLRQLMCLYGQYSENYYGDCGEVKVAARKDVSDADCHRIRQLSMQVFLLDSQRGLSPGLTFDPESQRSYVFLLYPPGAEQATHPDQYLVRVPFSNIVVGLLSQQLLLQTVGCVLLQGSLHVTQEVRHMMPSSPTEPQAKHGFDVDGLETESKLPGMLKHLSSQNAWRLLECLQSSYQFSCDFDRRPGLKFLIQKVMDSEVSANLYKQAGVSMTFYVHALLEICATHDSITVEAVRQMVSDTDLSAGGDANASPSRSFFGALSEVSASGTNQRTNRSVSLDSLGATTIKCTDSDVPVPISADISRFMKCLRSSCDALCQKYVDLLYDKYGETSSGDRISKQPLFLIAAQHDDISVLKRDKHISEIVREKLEFKRSQELAAMTTTAVRQQDELQESDGATDSSSEITPSDSLNENQPEEVSKRRKDNSKVYNLATAKRFLKRSGKTIHNLMMEYKKSKQGRAMPSRPGKLKNPSKPASEGPNMDIEQQQKESITKDADAHIQSWTEMLCTLLRLLEQLSDSQFRSLLPAVYPCNNQLICHARDPTLKEILAAWMHRMGLLYDIAPL